MLTEKPTDAEIEETICRTILDLLGGSGKAGAGIRRGGRPRIDWTDIIGHGGLGGQARTKVEGRSLPGDEGHHRGAHGRRFLPRLPRLHQRRLELVTWCRCSPSRTCGPARRTVDVPAVRASMGHCHHRNGVPVSRCGRIHKPSGTILSAGVESITFFSEEELLAAGEEADLVRHPHYVKAAPILQGYDGFDAAFFGYTPREARLMDPQHRLFLEVAWESLESAGYDPLGRAGTIGRLCRRGRLGIELHGSARPPELRGQTGDLGHISNDRDFLCSRVSFKLDLTGPSVNVQSACSTSLLAVDLACRALLDGVVDMAVAGASVVRVPHIRGYLAEPGNIYSVDGHCRAFDAKASGTLFGSGVAAVVVKPLRAALAAGDRVFAVIKGSAVTNDGGHKMSYTASTAEGQARAITEALAIARVEPETLGYVECHGTATSLGDPLEIQALTRAFRAGTKRAGFCPIGSVKSNLGHLEQCAGMAGLVKTVSPSSMGKFRRASTSIRQTRGSLSSAHHSS